jgi:hypothetical protein
LAAIENHQYCTTRAIRVVAVQTVGPSTIDAEHQKQTSSFLFSIRRKLADQRNPLASPYTRGFFSFYFTRKLLK